MEGVAPKASGGRWLPGLPRFVAGRSTREKAAASMTRRPFPTKVMVAAFERAADRCEKCSARLVVGKINYDHVIADALGGDPTLENCEVLCTACHSVKTRTKDVPAIAKAKRVKSKFIGAHRPKAILAGSKASKWKKPFNGPPILR